MEILYGIVLLIVFLIGLSIGLLIPYYIKKYIVTLQKEVDKGLEKKEEIPLDFSNPQSITKDLVNEWFYGGK